MTSNDLKELFSDSPTRPAGYRQALLINGEEYGFRWIPPGEFDMGSPVSVNMFGDDERLHHVKLTRGFWLLETPVTQRLYESVMGENPSLFKKFDYSRASLRNPEESDDFDDIMTRTLDGFFSDLPVEQACYSDILEFCNKLTESLSLGLKATLPTEAEWEYACRAGTNSPFWFGDSLNGDKANCDGGLPYPDGTETGPFLEQTSPVKRYAPNPWGLYDMHGNVVEWVQDWYGDYPTCEVTDPAGPSEGPGHVTRGGRWLFGAVFCRSTARSWEEPDCRSCSVGARLALRPQ